jgi:hypothetical protein
VESGHLFAEEGRRGGLPGQLSAGGVCGFVHFQGQRLFGSWEAVGGPHARRCSREMTALDLRGAYYSVAIQSQAVAGFGVD